MRNSTFIRPEVLARAFTCPHCNAIAQQQWRYRGVKFEGFANAEDAGIRISHCVNCEEYSIWLWDKMIFPNTGIAPPANQDMPELVRVIYNEAAEISSLSPRGASALLRLALQVLCKELGEKGENINDDIRSLVQKGLPATVQQSLDIVRVTGNNAVHPGQIDVDDQGVVSTLFDLINIIIEYMISLPAKVSATYNSLPPGALSAIEKRDNQN